MKPRQPDWILKPGTIDRQTGWCDPNMAARAIPTNDAPAVAPPPRVAIVARSTRRPGPGLAERIAARLIEARDNLRWAATVAGSILSGLFCEVRYAL